MKSRDYQRSKVYDWEDRVVAPRDRTKIEFGQAQEMVNAIWAHMELHFPPKVELLPKQSRRQIGKANRLSIFVAESVPSWCLLHELAHSMTSNVDGQSDWHGPEFMAVYLELLVRYMRFDRAELWDSLMADGIQVSTKIILSSALV